MCGRSRLCFSTIISCIAASAVALLCLSILASANAYAEDWGEDVLLEAQRERDRQVAEAREFVAALDLSDKQARWLLGLAAEAAPVHVEAYEQQSRLQPERLEAFREFAREDSLNQGFSSSVERRTADLSHRAKEAREEIVAQLMKLEEQALAVLTPEQQEVVRDFKPGGKHGKDKAGGHRRGPRRRGMGRAGNGPAGGRDRLTEARRELHDLRQQIHPRLGPVGRHLLHPAGADSLCQITGTRPNQALREAAEVFERGTTDYPVSVCDQHKAEIRELRAEIKNWNLINGLHLNGEQIAKIVSTYDAAKAEPDAPRRGANRRGRRPPGWRRELTVDLERAVEDVLNPGQLQVLAEYKPCLLPPKNLKDPVRAGQASDNSRFERWLDRVRRMPPGRLRRIVERMIDAEAERFGELSEAERSERAALLLDTARQAADMSDVEFELGKAELAEKIAPRDRSMELKGKIDALARGRGMPSMISHFMLKPQFIEQLRRRGRQLAEGAKHERNEQ